MVAVGDLGPGTWARLTVTGADIAAIARAVDRGLVPQGSAKRGIEAPRTLMRSEADDN